MCDSWGYAQEFLTGDICIKLCNIRNYFQKRNCLDKCHSDSWQCYVTLLCILGWKLGFVAGTTQLNVEFFLFELISSRWSFLRNSNVSQSIVWEHICAACHVGIKELLMLPLIVTVGGAHSLPPWNWHALLCCRSGYRHQGGQIGKSVTDSAASMVFHSSFQAAPSLPSGPTMDQKLHDPRNVVGDQFPWSGWAAKGWAFSSQGYLDLGLDSVWADTVLWISELSLHMWLIPGPRAHLMFPPAPFIGLRGLSVES